MSLTETTYWVVGASFALYVLIAIRSRAGSTQEFYVAGKGNTIHENNMVAYYTVVCDMNISHDKTVFSYHGFTIRFSSPINGNTFTNGGTVSYFNSSAFALEL